MNVILTGIVLRHNTVVRETIPKTMCVDSAALGKRVLLTAIVPVVNVVMLMIHVRKVEIAILINVWLVGSLQ